MDISSVKTEGLRLALSTVNSKDGSFQRKWSSYLLQSFLIRLWFQGIHSLHRWESFSPVLNWSSWLSVVDVWKPKNAFVFVRTRSIYFGLLPKKSLRSSSSSSWIFVAMVGSRCRRYSKQSFRSSSPCGSSTISTRFFVMMSSPIWFPTGVERNACTCVFRSFSSRCGSSIWLSRWWSLFSSFVDIMAKATFRFLVPFTHCTFTTSISTRSISSVPVFISGGLSTAIRMRTWNWPNLIMSWPTRKPLYI